ncbi:MAG: hypothetical protein Q9160_000801 [Pyrenula sp. 1 TL-2023]
MPSAITLTVSNLSNSTSFFLSALQPLDYQYRGATDNNTTIAFGSSLNPDSPPDFWLTQEIPGVPAGAAHVAFPAKTRIAVQQFFSAALKAGARVHGEPAVRDASSGYYSGAVIDFDGNSIEAVYRPIHLEDSKEDVPNGDNSIARAATTTQISRAVTTSHSPKAEATRAPSASTKVHTAQSGDVIDVATNLARNVASHLRPGSSPSTGSPKNSKDENDTRGSKATIGALLGVAAGAALTYAFGSKDKDKDRDSKDRHGHRPFSPPRSSTYPSPSAKRYRSSASDLPGEDYRYTQSPLEIGAPPPLRRRSSSCHSPSSSRRHGTTVDDFEHHRRHRRESSGTTHRSSSRRSRRDSLQPVDAPPPSVAPTTATSKHSHHSHTSRQPPSDASPTKHSKRDRDRDSDRTSYPPSSFSPTTRSKLASAAGTGTHPIAPPSRSQTYDDDATGSIPNPSPNASVSTIKPARRSTITDHTHNTRNRRNSKSSSHTHTHTPTTTLHETKASIPLQPPPPSQPRRRPRADTWAGPDSRPDSRRDHDRWRLPHRHHHRRSEDVPPAAAAAPRPPAPPFYRRKSRSHGDSAEYLDGSGGGGGGENRHRSRKGSMRRRRVVGVDDADGDFGGVAGAADWERGLRERGLKGGVMDREIGPDDSISQVSTNVVS